MMGKESDLGEKMKAKLASLGKKAWDEEGTDHVTSWSEFTQSTTLHGIKYVFDSQGTTRSRRWIWVVCILAAMGAFALQSYTRLNDYLKYESNINVKINFPDNLTMPAVTICNQNNFRMSMVAKLGLYNTIDAVFNKSVSARLDQAELQETLAGIEDSEWFMLETGHLATNLIHECKWAGEACNASHFVKRITDLGVCYTFDATLTQTPLVKEAGANNGLSLILNTEQYDYMKGPQTDAGVKVMLHDPDEVPLMADVGFAVAPGTHTFVGFKLRRFSSLSAPHGNCDNGNVALSTCQLACWRNNAVEMFGCAAPYLVNPTYLDMDGRMRSSNTSTAGEICDLNRTVSQLQDDRFKDTNRAQSRSPCRCAVPCQRNIYDTIISFAHLSQFNVGSMVFKDADTMAKLTDTFLLARETSQYVIDFIRDRDVESFRQMLGVTKEMSNSIPKLMDMLVNNPGSQMIRSLLLTDVYAIFDHLWQKMVYAEKEMVEPLAVPSCGFKFYLDVIGSVLMGMDEEAIVMQANLEKCDSGDEIIPKDHCGKEWFQDMTTDTEQDMTEYASYMQYTQQVIDTCNVTYIEGCSHDTYYQDVVLAKAEAENGTTCDICQQYVSHAFLIAGKLSHFMETDANSSLVKLNSGWQEYLTRLEKYFNENETGYGVPDDISFIECKSTYHAIDEIFHSLIRNVKLFVGTPVNDTSALLTNFLALQTEYFQAKDMFNQGMMEDLPKTCGWVYTLLKQKLKKNSGIEFSAGGLIPSKNLRDSFRDVTEISYPKFLAIWEKNKATFNETILPQFRNISRYLDYLGSGVKSGAITKLTLATDMRILQEDMKTLIDDVMVMEERVDMCVGSSQRAIYTVAEFCETTFPGNGNALFAYTDQLARKFGMIDVILKAGIQGVKLETYLPSKTRMFGGNLCATGSLLFSRWVEKLAHATEDLKRIRRSLAFKFSNVAAELAAYAKKCTMDEDFVTDNFITLDIFYQDMSFELVEQQESFTLISFFSEIGGFLGLLLGASVLTVCEVFDFIAVGVLAAYHKKKKKVRPSQTPVKVLENKE